jgi:hypothetical protein
LDKGNLFRRIRQPTEQVRHGGFNGAADSTDVSRAGVGELPGEIALQFGIIERAADMAFLQEALGIAANKSGEFHRLANWQRAARIERDRQIFPELMMNH